MEKLMSSNANDVNLTEVSSIEEVMLPLLSVGGRESKGGVEEDYVLVKSRGEEFEDLDEEDDEEDNDFDDIDDDDDDDDEEEDEEWMERLRIFEDARNLRKVASFFLHPEKPVECDPIYSARCFFSRSSAVTEEEECANILEDAALLKKYAKDYLHPELSAETTDLLALGRNYFMRPSAVQQETTQYADERARIIEDAMMLKKNAVDYYYPEAPISNDGVSTAMGRNYFTRASAMEQETKEDADERARIMADAQLMKKNAAVYYYPEAPINTSGLDTAMGRNYFTRASATEQETKEDADESARILADARLLKKQATVYYHPEAPIEHTGVSTSMGRNYFTRVSAMEQETKGDADERARIMADAQLMKKNAVVYYHPEAPINTSGLDTAMGRNYFTRVSAMEQETKEDADERARILADAGLLKKQATVYYYPEAPIENTGESTSMGRNYFTRVSAMEQETKEDGDERARILADAGLLKKQATVYYHPEAPIENTGVSTSMGRNYFTRVSAMEQETKEEADERARIMADAQLMKKNATVYYHPEAPINTSGLDTAMGRNYFTRASATEQETKEEADERACILADAKLMVKNATMYYHPEAPINADGINTAMGRNYFTRASAMEQETKEEADECARILADAHLLMKNATMYYHPEAPINTDGVGTAMGRNYFTRPSAVIAKVGKVELGRKIRGIPKKVVAPNSKSITTKHVFAGKLSQENDINEMPRSASAVMLFHPNGDMGEAF